MPGAAGGATAGSVRIFGSCGTDEIIGTPAEVALSLGRHLSRVVRHRYHAKDQLPHFLVEGLSSNPLVSRFPGPITLETGPVPTYDRLRLHDDQSLLPVPPQMAHQNPEEFVRWPESRVRVPCLQNSNLLTEGQILKQQLGSGDTARTSSPKNKLNVRSILPL